MRWWRGNRGVPASSCWPGKLRHAGRTMRGTRGWSDIRYSRWYWRRFVNCSPMRGRRVEVLTRGARGDDGEKRMELSEVLIWGLRGRDLGRCTGTCGAAGDGGGVRVCSGGGVPARHQDFGQLGNGYLWTAGSSSRPRSHQRHHQTNPALLATRLPRLLPDAHIMYPAAQRQRSLSLESLFANTRDFQIR